MTIALAELIGADNRIDDLEGTTAERVIGELIECIGARESFDTATISSIQRSIVSREREATTGIGNGIAVPHMKECPHVSELRVAFGRTRAGLDYGATDGEPVHVLFLILTPAGKESDHIQLMKRIVLLGRDKSAMQHLTTADPLDNLREIFEEVDAGVS
ncbi:MAG: PTS sugar transporter subunit IIA [Planctomycetota bacterium]